MDDEIQSASNYVTAPTKNVGSRVSTWLTGFVGEVSQKSSSTLQKWIHSSSATSTDKDIPVLKNTDQISQNNATPTKPDNNEKIKEFQISNNFCIENTTDPIDSNIAVGEKVTCSRVSKLKKIGTIKIHELYNLVHQAKGSQIDIKQTKMESLDNNAISSIPKTCNEPRNSTNLNQPFNNNTSNIDIQNRDISDCDALIENELNISEDELPNFENFERTMKLSMIGRASTVQEMYTLKPINVLLPKNHQNTFVPMTRSYSEQQDDENSEYDKNYILNDRSRSYNQNVTDVKEHNSDEHEKIVSNSLPSFLEQSGNYNSTPKTNNDLLLYKVDKQKNFIVRGNSYQSDSSHCSSVDSLLDSRKPDPEAILINLGFGPIESEDILSKIPKRFLQPSKVKGIDTEAFLRRQQMANNIHDHTVLGYRGLVGNPDIPPSTIVAKIMERFELNERHRSVSDINMNRPQSAPPNSLDILKS